MPGGHAFRLCGGAASRMLERGGEEAFFRLRVGVVSRSAGGNAVKRAAYQAAETFTDENTGEVFDFSHKRHEVQHAEIIAPPEVPDWVRDSRQLWNRAERSERRGDAQVARVLDFAVPREVPEDRRADFCRHLLMPYVEQGMVVDFAVQVVTASDGLPQPHCSAELTMRPLDPATETGFAKRKDRTWNEQFAEFGRKPGAGSSHLPAASKARDMRAEFAARANQWLAINGIGMRVDLRSNDSKQVERSTQPQLPKWVIKHCRKYPRAKWCRRAREMVQDLEQFKEREAQRRLYLKNSEFVADIERQEIDRLRRERAAEIAPDGKRQRGFVRPAKPQRQGWTWHILGSPDRPPGIDIDRVTLSLLELSGGISIQDMGDGWLMSEEMTAEAALLMISELQARGADEILVEGDPESQRMLWRAAILRGLDPSKIHGYQPTKLDMEWADIQPSVNPVQPAPASASASQPEQRAAPAGRSKPVKPMPRPDNSPSLVERNRMPSDLELEREARKVMDELEAELKPGGPSLGPR